MVHNLVFALLVIVAANSPVLAQGAVKSAGDRNTPSSTQAVVKDVQRLAPPLSCDLLSAAEGLPSSTVRAIIQDRRGFLWFGTEDGLTRYDGIKMQVYRSVADDPSSISGGFITALALDANGKLWAGTADNGVNLYDPDTDRFTRFGRGKGGLSSEGVTSIARDRKGTVWFAMSGGGLNRFESTSGTFTPLLNAPLDGPITAIDTDATGNLWLGTASVGVIRWNPNGGSTTSYRATPDDENGLAARPIAAIHVATDGKVWIGTDGDGLYALDPASSKLVPHRHDPSDPGTISNDHISVVVEDQQKTLWIGTQQGLNRMDPSGRVIRYQHDASNPLSLSFVEVEAIYQDTGGIMWVGGLSHGVCKFNDARRKFGLHYTGGTYATSFFEDTDKTLWVGSYSGGLYKYERGAQRVTVYHTIRSYNEKDAISLDENWISSLHRDKRGTLWIAVKGEGLIAFDTNTETYRQYLPDPKDADSIPVDFVQDIWEDDKGMIWLGSWGGGLVRLDPTRDVFTVYNVDGAVGLTSDYIYTIAPDPKAKNLLWIGEAKGGLVKFNMDTGTGTSFRQSADSTSLSSDDVVTIYPDPDGTIWVGTYGGGLNRLDPASGKAQRFTTANSALTNDSIFGILPDAEGKLWMSTNGGGLLQFDPKTSTFLAYGPSDGVQDTVFGQGSFMRSKSGELFFGGIGGFNAFFPREITRDAYVPPVVMTAFKVNNRDVKLDKPIWMLPSVEVSYTDSFELQFAALSFAAPKKNRYSYKLEGFDNNFVETDRPYAPYNHLDGGRYTLRVRASNENGVWNEHGVALQLAVKPPPWKTWWAYVGYVLTLVLLVVALILAQRRRITTLQRRSRLDAVERDLELTGAVQSGFLPALSEIETPRVSVFGYYRPADACGGDWWWHEELPGGRHVVLCGDVTGHGPGPAMVTAAVATAFRVLVENGLDDTEQGLHLLNREVLRVGRGRYHMTMAAVELEDVTGEFVYYSAGAPPALSLNRAGKHRVHFCPGAPLGTESGFEVGRVEGKLEPTERIMLYTDGIPEIEMANGTQLGMRRFAQVYERTHSQRVAEAAATIVAHGDQIRGARAQLDDWTFTIVEWHDVKLKV